MSVQRKLPEQVYLDRVYLGDDKHDCFEKGYATAIEALRTLPLNRNARQLAESLEKGEFNEQLLLPLCIDCKGEGIREDDVSKFICPLCNGRGRTAKR